MYRVAFCQSHGVRCLHVKVGDAETQGSCYTHGASSVGEGNASIDAALLDVGEWLELDGIVELAVARNIISAGDASVTFVLIGDFVLADRQFGETVLREQFGVAVHSYLLRSGEYGEGTGVWDRGFHLYGLVALAFHFERGGLALAVLLAGFHYVGTCLQALVPGTDTHLLAIKIDVCTISHGYVHGTIKLILIFHLQGEKLVSILGDVDVLIIVHVTVAGGDVVDSVGKINGLR